MINRATYKPHNAWHVVLAWWVVTSFWAWRSAITSRHLWRGIYLDQQPRDEDNGDIDAIINKSQTTPASSLPVAGQRTFNNLDCDDSTNLCSLEHSTRSCKHFTCNLAVAAIHRVRFPITSSWAPRYHACNECGLYDDHHVASIINQPMTSEPVSFTQVWRTQ